tara:strand:- start:3956 stop:5104 length:1149 start_codon:yes stop_codon:yes gene_type:complete
LDIIFIMKKIVIIGSTGSIGTQTLEICSNNNKDIEVYGLTAGKNIEKLKSQILKYKPKFYDNLEKINFEIKNTQLKDSINLVSDQNVDFILFASSGSKAYLPIVESLRSGKTVGLTNKEVIVTFGPLLFQIAKSNGAKIFPVDSEPSAIWQCIDGDSKTISKIILTASGGIFRDLDVKEYKNITTDQAKQHPNWDMGEKITVDSSTMMNKIFEIVETSYLFDIPIENIEVLIHRESLVHSMVEFLDGSIKAQISKTDMKLPIQHAIGFESKNFNYSNKLNLSDLNNLSFSEVQIGKYPCYDFALDYIKKGPLYVSALSITNEILVDLFLAEKISFVSIADLMIETLINEKFEYEITFENIIEMREILENKIFNRIKSNANNY